MIKRKVHVACMHADLRSLLLEFKGLGAGDFRFTGLQGLQ